jgi:hypothetical protein
MSFGVGGMRRVARRIAIALAIASSAASTLSAAPALAECPDGMREFRGAISAIDGRKLYVDSRLDDNIGFERAPDTKIVDEAGRGRSRWAQLSAGDAVVICWRFDDRPRKAVTITLRR